LPAMIVHGASGSAWRSVPITIARRGPAVRGEESGLASGPSQTTTQPVRRIAGLASCRAGLDVGPGRRAGRRIRRVAAALTHGFTSRVHRVRDSSLRPARPRSWPSCGFSGRRPLRGGRSPTRGTVAIVPRQNWGPGGEPYWRILAGAGARGRWAAAWRRGGPSAAVIQPAPVRALGRRRRIPRVAAENGRDRQTVSRRGETLAGMNGARYAARRRPFGKPATGRGGVRCAQGGAGRG